MSTVGTYLRPSSNTRKMPLYFIKEPPSVAKKDRLYPAKNKQVSFDGIQAQVRHYTSLIEDPLWKHVCIETVKMMGPFSLLKIWYGRLGTFSPQDKAIDFYCQTEETAQFVQQYAFVILGILQRYFPTLKEIRVLRERFIQESDEEKGFY